MPRLFALVFALAAACASSQLKPPDDSKEFFRGHAEGAQIYTCAPKAGGGGNEWKLKAPDAEVVGTSGERLKHFAGPTWEAADGSRIVGEVKQRLDVDATTIPLLLLSVKSTGAPGLLAQARWVQRLDTTGGKAPADGCDAAHDGAEARVPYTATYAFWGP